MLSYIPHLVVLHHAKDKRLHDNNDTMRFKSKSYITEILKELNDLLITRFNMIQNGEL